MVTQAQDTFVDEGEASTDKGNVNYVAVDLFDGGSDATTQGLIRFDNIFGSGANQIPEESTINSATLTVYVDNDSEVGAKVTLHRVLQDWTDGSTWNTFVNGVQTDDVEAKSTADSTIANPEQPD